MTGGRNGSTPLQNLTQLRQKPIFETPAELELTKCEAHPTKRMWTNDLDAIREAEVRSTAAKMPISAYRCDSCGNAHLCKAEAVRPGSLLERPGPELPLVLGNADAKRKMLREYLAEHEEPSTDELVEMLGVGKSTLGAYMKEAGWHNTRGRFARWIKDAEPTTPKARIVVADFSPGVGNPTPIESAKSRHPSTQNVGWSPMIGLEKIRHMAVGDLMDMLTAMGRELRIETREK